MPISTIINLLLATAQILWLFLPAIFANSMPVIAARFGWLPALNKPLDGGKLWRNRALFGEHKTIRGIVVGVASAALIGAFQYLARDVAWIRSISLISYHSMTFTIAFTALLGLSALIADAVKSLIKRQCDIRPGKSWPPYDQIDFVIGVLITASFFIALTPLHIVLALIIFGAGSFFVSAIGVVFGIKQSL